MADMGFPPQVHQIKRRIGGSPQVMLFSATFDGQVQGLITRYLKRSGSAMRWKLMGTSPTNRPIGFLKVHRLDKPKGGARIIRSVKRTLVIASTPPRAPTAPLKTSVRKGIDAHAIHGDLKQSDWERRLADFTEGRLSALVATNLARHAVFDISDVDVVLHYEPPQDYKAFIHRSGRTARAGESGLVVTLVEWDQVEDVKRIQGASGLNYEIVKIFSNDDRLGDLVAHEPGTVELRRTSDAELSEVDSEPGVVGGSSRRGIDRLRLKCEVASASLDASGLAGSCGGVLLGGCLPVSLTRVVLSTRASNRMRPPHCAHARRGADLPCKDECKSIC